MSPAVKMAEIQQVELPVVLRVVDGVHVLEDTQRGDRDTRDGYVKALPLLSGGLLKAARVAAPPPHPLHFLLAADPVVVAERRVGLGEASWKKGWSGEDE